MLAECLFYYRLDWQSNNHAKLITLVIFNLSTLVFIGNTNKIAYTCQALSHQQSSNKMIQDHYKKMP